MPFLVYLQGQNISIDPAPHRTTRETAGMVVDAGYGGHVGQHAIQLWTPHSWKEIKRLVTGTDADPCPELEAYLDHYPPYNYPLPYSLLRQYQRPRIA